MLKENKVKIRNYHFEHQRFDQLRKSIYKNRGRHSKPIPLYDNKDMNPDWWIIPDGDLGKDKASRDVISIVDMGDALETTQELVMTPRKISRQDDS